MILRTDHVSGAVLAAFGLGTLAISGDLPTGTLSFPGAGMMPKLIASLLVFFAFLLVLRGRDSAPLATVQWNDLPHAARVVAVTAIAVALYQLLGFVITMAAMLFVLVAAVERRSPAAAALFAATAVGLTYLLFNVALRTPLEPGRYGF